VDYEFGYAETIPDEDDDVNDGGIYKEENLDAQGQSEGMEGTIHQANQAQRAEVFRSSDSLS
jgi:hypothetical protein